jgi:hypothetical protein
MSTTSQTPVDASTPHEVPVRRNGGLFRMASPTEAAKLVTASLGVWRGSGNRLHVELTSDRPSAHGAVPRGSDGTRPVRADETCRTYGYGQLLGDRRSHREFKTN